MASPASAVRNAGLIAAVAPVLVVIVARWMLGGEPIDVSADPTAQPPQAAVLTPRLTEPQRAAGEFALKALERPFESSPMSQARPQPVTGEDASEVESQPTPAPPPIFNVTSILVSARRQLATINGSLYRIGEEITPGWRLTTIDAARGVVVIISESGQRVEAPVHRSDR